MKVKREESLKELESYCSKRTGKGGKEAKAEGKS